MADLNDYQKAMFGGDSPKPIEEPKEQPEEAKPEEAEPEPESQPESQPEEAKDDPVKRIFAEEGLSKRFRDPSDALRYIREQDRYVTQREQELAEYRRLVREGLQRKPEQQTPAQEPISSDDFYSDPATALQRMGIVKRDDLTPFQQKLAAIEARLEQEDSQRFFDSHDDLREVGTALRDRRDLEQGRNQVWDRMKAIFSSNPRFEGWPASTLLPFLYNAAKGEIGYQAPPPQQPVDEEKKATAKTVSGKTQRTPTKDYSKMSIDDLEKEFGFGT